MHIHRLHRRAAGTLAQVVQAGHHQHLRVGTEHEQIHPIRVVAGLHVERAFGQGVGIAQRHHADEALALVMRGKRLLHGLRRRACAHLAQMQGDGHAQALVEVADDGHEDRRRQQPCVRHHLGQVLVGQTQRIRAR